MPQHVLYAICYIQKLRYIRQDCSQLHQNMWEYFHAINYTYVDCSWNFIIDQANIKMLSNTGVRFGTRLRKWRVSSLQLHLCEWWHTCACVRTSICAGAITHCLHRTIPPPPPCCHLCCQSAKLKRLWTAVLTRSFSVIL